MRAAASLVPLAALILVAASPAPTSATLSVRLSGHEAKAVVDELARDGQFDAVLDRIGRGSTDWVGLAPRLAPGTDAAASEGLGIALAQALPTNAAAVLRAASSDDGPIGIDHICSVPFIETTKAQDDAYTRRTLAALSRVHDPSLADKRAQCRKALLAP